MTRILFGILVVVALVLLVTKYIQDPETTKSGFVRDQPKEVEIKEELIFVPYWTLNSQDDISAYDTLIYFGVAADENGIISDSGVENVDAFHSKRRQGQKTLLTLRLIDNDTNAKILDDENSQKSIIQDTISFAKENNFDGIVIDFETKSIGFEEVTQDTTDFLTSSLKEIKNNDLEAHTLLFGDTYYRARAFDVQSISQASDSIMIMAYDFHKSGGGIPGPTFPTYERSTYGYDFLKMLDDFAKDAPPDKTTVILGMFGYDWNEDGVSESITTKEAQLSLLNSCQKQNCKVTIDPKSKEAKINYSQEGVSHEVWVETDSSLQVKKEEMQKKGIGKVGYWAHSFF